MNTQVELVIARYKEDVSWVEQTGFATTVYDKSGEQSERPGWVPLPNIGRESHTYLHHIVTTYPQFPDYTVFLQGSPFDHLSEQGDAAVEDLARMIDECVARKVLFKGLAWYVIRCNALGQPHQMHDASSQGKWAGHGRDIPVGELYSRLFAGDVPQQYTVRAPAGLLVVSRERLLLRPLELYKTALAMVEYDPYDRLNTGHAMERLWPIVFNGYTPLNKEQYQLPPTPLS